MFVINLDIGGEQFFWSINNRGRVQSISTGPQVSSVLRQGGDKAIAAVPCVHAERQGCNVSESDYELHKELAPLYSQHPTKK